MVRTLIIAAVVVVLLAVGAVVAVVINAGKPATAPVASAPAEPVRAKPTAPVAENTPDFSAVREPPRPGQADAEGEGAAGGPGSAGGGGDAEGDEAANERIAALVKEIQELSDEDRGRLMREVGRSFMQRREENERYNLPSDRRLRRLFRTRDEALRLTETQQQQINDLKAGYRPQMDVLLQDVWAQQAELRNQAGELMSSGNRDQARELWGQIRELNQQAEQIVAPLESQYSLALSGILTPAQAQALAQESSNNGGGDRGDRRRPGGGPPGGFNR